MRWIVPFLLCFVLGQPAAALDLRLSGQSLSDPVSGSASVDCHSRPARCRGAAVAFGVWLGLPVTLIPAMLGAFYLQPRGESPPPLGDQLMIGSVWPSVGTAVFGSLLTWGLARAFGVRASFVPVLVASLVTRLLISSGSILAGGTNGYGSIGAFLVAPILGLTAEVITAQWEEDEAKPTVTPTPPERPVVQSGGQTSDWVPTVAVIRFAF